MAFTDAPRNLGQGVLVLVNTNGGSARAIEKVADVLTNYELLQTQAKGTMGQELWTTKIEPLL